MGWAFMLGERPNHFLNIMTIATKLKNFRTLDLQGLGMSVLIDQKQSVIKLNQEQMLSNEDSLGGTLGDYQSDAYRRFKLRLGRTGKVDLYNTGSFQQAMKLNALSKIKYELTSTDSKLPMLRKNYGPNMFGLNADSVNEYRKEFMPDLIDKVKAYVNAE